MSSEKKRKVLFICRKGMNRSPTAEKVFKKLLSQLGYKVFDKDNIVDFDVEVNSAGLQAVKGGNQVTREMLKKCSEIYVFEPRQQEVLITEYGQPKEKIVCLNIPDIYSKDNSEELEALLRSKLLDYVHKEK